MTLLFRRLQFAGKLDPAHAIWHHDIAEQEIELLAIVEDLNGFRTVSRAKDFIAERGQHRRGNFQQVLIVLDHEDLFRASRYRLRLDSFDLGIGLLRGFGQVHGDRGPELPRCFRE